VTANCPACGQPLPDNGIRVDPSTRVVIRDGRATYLPPVQFRLFAALYRVYPAGLSNDALIRQMYADDKDGGPNCIAASACNVNKRVRCLSMQVTAKGGPGSEYRLIIGALR
jgi:DNA-binding response OmpR family regulator